ncbi:uncharacterized protein YndB with AHSA1/START domain [Rhizobium sp. BK609]|nr:uncharacterized protein YndB with AHSA1/START domain [Rhizobium sp. BK098]MBB3617369.1 uncharacterized protein YndB with AHSA1/START domain [Rhizobium sp. BK609]MBB3682795.1 uncharacterized protein YndB with AHSA1/START domain [Rhizobium sp. BK612]
MAGTTVIWWKNAAVEVNEVEANKRIVFHWDGGTGEDGGTLVIIEESGWREDEAGRRGTYLNCEGWTQMRCCMKAFVEYGINLREGFFLSEMRGDPAEAPDR